jgi:hypothetical protein
MPKPSFIKPRFRGWTTTTTTSPTDPSTCSNHNLFKSFELCIKDVNKSINFGDGGGSEEKRPKIWEIGLYQRRRGAILSVQSKAIN